MKHLPSPRFHCLALLAIMALLSACGGGSAGKSSAAGPAAAVPPAAGAAPSPPLTDSPSKAAAPTQTSDVPVPEPASAPAQLSWNDPADAGYTLIPATPAETGGEAPYPDLRNLPTRAMPFESVAFGDVAGVAVKPAP